MTLNNCISLQGDLHSLDEWSNESRMKFSSSKCNILTVMRKKSPIEYPYSLAGNELGRRDEESDLGK
jgi:hypothetical protein